jgi:uncharacterized protein (TIGR03067 family)
MRTYRFRPFGLLALVGALATIGAGSADEPKKADKPSPKIEGKWDLMLTFGKADKPVKVNVTITAVRMQFGALKFLDSSYKLVPGGDPQRIDVMPLEGPYKGRVLPSLVRLEGDTLTICLGKVDEERPTEFSEQPGKGGTLMVMRRSK